MSPCADAVKGIVLDSIPVCPGAAILFVWGVVHVVSTRNVAGFGPLTKENRIITIEGVTV